MPTLLILDDTDVMRTVLAKELMQRGYTVHQMESKADGYDWICRHHTDLVITDLNSPGIDGFQFLDFMMGNPRTRTVPVIVYTGFSMEGAALKAMDAGAAGVAHKGDNFVDLLELIKRTIAASKN